MTKKPPLWHSIYLAISAQIDQGELRPGDDVPSERGLMDQWGVSRDTVRRAFERLVADGRVTEGRRGTRRQVREYNPLRWELHNFEVGRRRDDPAAGLDEWAAQVVEQGRTPREEILGVSTGQASAEVASWLTSEAGTLLAADRAVVIRRRLRYADGEPVQIATSYFPARIAVGTRLTEPRDVVERGGVLASIGQHQTAVQHIIRPRQPHPDEAELLRLPRGTAVADVVIIGVRRDGLPVRAMATVARGDEVLLVYRMSTAWQT